MRSESNPELAIRMLEVRMGGHAAGYAHAYEAINGAPTESAYMASERLASERSEDEREPFIAAFYDGLNAFLSPKFATPRRLRF